MRLSRFALLLVFALPLSLPAHASETPAEHAANVYAQQELDTAPLHSNLPDYSLTPDELTKSQQLSKVHVTMHFVSEAWDIISLLLLLWLGIIAWMRDTAVRLSKSRWIQGFTFLLLYLVVGTLVSLPIDLYEQHLSLAYGLSVQSWGGWFREISKCFMIGWIFGGLLVMLGFWLIRKFPRTWWLIGWGFSIPLVFFVIFVGPYVNYAFNTYEPLQKNNPQLVAQLEQVVHKTGMDIQPERMYLMKASEKVTTLNADVEGFVSSKRVVVWDNTIAKATPDEIMLIFGHESGHYVLGHIEQTVPFALGLIFISLFLGYHFIQWSIRRFGAKWRIPDQGDWATLAVPFSCVLPGRRLLTEPVESSFSRVHEHAADVYGQEVIHGLVPNPQATAQAAFDVLGKVSYSDPNPSPFYEFWTYSHPAVGRRAAFAHAYDPLGARHGAKVFSKEVRMVGHSEYPVVRSYARPTLYPLSSPLWIASSAKLPPVPSPSNTSMRTTTSSPFRTSTRRRRFTSCSFPNSTSPRTPTPRPKMQPCSDT